MDSHPLIYFVIVALAIVYVHPIANDDAIEEANSDVDHQLPVASALSDKVDAKSDAIGLKRKADDGDQANARKYMKTLSLPKRSALSAFKNLRAKQDFSWKKLREAIKERHEQQGEATEEWDEERGEAKREFNEKWSGEVERERNREQGEREREWKEWNRESPF